MNVAKMDPKQKLNILNKLFCYPCKISDRQIVGLGNMPDNFEYETFSIKKKANGAKSYEKKLQSNLRKRLRSMIGCPNEVLRKDRARNGGALKSSFVSIMVKGDSVQMMIETKLGKQKIRLQWIEFGRLDKELIGNIKYDLHEYIVPTARINARFLESTLPNLFPKAEVINSVSGKKMGSISDQANQRTAVWEQKDNMTVLLPLLMDIRRFIKHPPQFRSDKLMTVEAGGVKYHIIGVDFISQLYGGNDNLKCRKSRDEELPHLDSPNLLVGNRGKDRVFCYHNNGFIHSREFLDTLIEGFEFDAEHISDLNKLLKKRMVVCVRDDILRNLDLDKKLKFRYLKVPDLRRTFEQFSYLKLRHKKAVIWGILRASTKGCSIREIDKLCEVWGIVDNPTNPARKTTHFKECLGILLRIGLIHGYEFSESSRGKALIRFKRNLMYMPARRSAEYKNIPSLSEA